MILAHLKQTAAGYEGVVETLTCSPGELRIEANPDKSHERTPDYRVYRGASEVGAAWTKNTKQGGSYLAVTLDAPSFAAPVQCRLVRSASGFQLVWSR